MHSTYLDAIRTFEGFTAKADWDYAQFTNGYGTRARHAGEVIDKAEADRRFAAEISEARAIVERHAPEAAEGTKAALTSLTFNAGSAWTRDGLGDAVRRGDLERVREIFVQYNKAGGEVLPGLASRRLAEAAWIGAPQQPAMPVADGLDVAGTIPGAPWTAVVAASSDALGDLASDRARSLAPDVPLAAAAHVASPLDGRLADLPDLRKVGVVGVPEAEGGAAVRLAATVSGFAGEARLTQLLLASKLIGAASSRDEDVQDTGRATV